MFRGRPWLAGILQKGDKGEEEETHLDRNLLYSLFYFQTILAHIHIFDVVRLITPLRNQSILGMVTPCRVSNPTLLRILLHHRVLYWSPPPHCPQQVRP